MRKYFKNNQGFYTGWESFKEYYTNWDNFGGRFYKTELESKETNEEKLNYLTEKYLTNLSDEKPNIVDEISVKVLEFKEIENSNTIESFCFYQIHLLIYLKSNSKIFIERSFYELFID